MRAGGRRKMGDGAGACGAAAAHGGEGGAGVRDEKAGEKESR